MGEVQQCAYAIIINLQDNCFHTCVSDKNQFCVLLHLLFKNNFQLDKQVLGGNRHITMNGKVGLLKEQCARQNF